MGIGHLGASFALRARFPRVPFFLLLAAGVLVDVFWGIAILSGLEKARIDTGSGSVVPLVLEHVPFTHSLPACLLWAALASLGWWLWRRDRAGALVLGALVLSHWVLDLVSHVGDIPSTMRSYRFRSAFPKAVSPSWTMTGSWPASVRAREICWARRTSSSTTRICIGSWCRRRHRPQMRATFLSRAERPNSLRIRNNKADSTAHS